MPSPSPRRKVPVIRFILVGLLACFFYEQFTTGWLASYWESRSAPVYSEVTPAEPEPRATPLSSDPDWKKWCVTAQGTVFTLKKGWGQCSWLMPHRQALRQAAAHMDSASARRLLFAADMRLSTYPMQLHWVAPQDSFSQAAVLDLRNADSSLRLLVIRDSLTGKQWIDASTGCAFPGPCPRTPLEGGAIPIPADFDFAGREHLLSQDQFRGIGESPVFPVLPGSVYSIVQEPTGYAVTLYHGKNLYSRISGLTSLFPDLAVQAWHDFDKPIGRLSSQDTATVFLQFLRNGRFVRWADFWRETRPLSPERIATFRKSTGY